MKSDVGRNWHGAAGDLENTFVERGFLLGGREFADFGKIDVLPSFEYVIADDPIGWHGIVEPGEMSFVGMTAVARLFEDLFHFRRGFEVRDDGRIVERKPDELEGQDEEEKDTDSAE